MEMTSTTMIATMTVWDHFGEALSSTSIGPRRNELSVVALWLSSRGMTAENAGTKQKSKTPKNNTTLDKVINIRREDVNRVRVGIARGVRPSGEAAKKDATKQCWKGGGTAEL
jgi:hypothetical protein